jgi:hypothetical protein
MSASASASMPSLNVSPSAPVEEQLAVPQPTDALGKYRTLPESTAAAQRDLLILQARCKVAGHNMDSDFEKLRQLLDHYFALLRDLRGAI